jgi:putative phosphoesterase
VSQRIVGVISDTHGLVRPGALAELHGADLIVHCGDVGAPSVLDVLRAVAPVRAVRGNNDRGAWAADLPRDDVIDVGAQVLYVLHDRAELDLEPAAAGFSAVLCGHSHRPSVAREHGVLYVNPGSAGPRRFALPVALARLVVGPGRCDATIVELAV